MTARRAAVPLPQPDGRDAVLLSEVASVLAGHGRLRCLPELAHESGVVTLTVRLSVDALPTPAHEGLEVLELHAELQRVVDACQVRLFALRYGMDGLAEMLPKAAKERA